MALTLNPESARAADTLSNAIKNSGKYIGTITRAEKLVSSSGKNTPGLGLSFKSDNGETADYLDQWLGETDGKPWTGTNNVNAIMCCLRLKQAQDGKVKVEKWNADSKQRETSVVEGYPDIQGKRIGLLLQKVLTTYNGKEQEKLEIYGVFDPESGLTASEILAKASKAEKLDKMVTLLMANPIRDKRAAPSTGPTPGVGPRPAPGSSFDDLDSDIPF